VQSNSEGALVDAVQSGGRAGRDRDHPAAYTHTSIAPARPLGGGRPARVGGAPVEHPRRRGFRHASITAPSCRGVIAVSGRRLPSSRCGPARRACWRRERRRSQPGRLSRLRKALGRRGPAASWSRTCRTCAGSAGSPARPGRCWSRHAGGVPDRFPVPGAEPARSPGREIRRADRGPRRRRRRRGPAVRSPG